jgi:hypothetical protein
VDLTDSEHGFSNKDRIQPERKEDMKRRGPASRDLGDCLAMTVAVDIAFRSRKPHNWSTPSPSQNA